MSTFRFFNIVQKVKGDFAYKTINDPGNVKFDKHSVLEQFPTLEPPEWLMYYDAYDSEDGEGEVIYQLSIVPDVRWVVDAAPHFYKIKHSKHSFHGESQDYLKDFKVDYSRVEGGDNRIRKNENEDPKGL